MSWLPRDTALGELTVVETFVFFDGPRVFSCRSITDQLYVAAWAEEFGDYDRWLYVPVSTRRLGMIRSGGIPLRYAFVNPEGPVYLATLPDDESERDGLDLVTGDVDDRLLPGQDFRLQLDTATLRIAEPDESISQHARQEGRTRFRLHVVLPSYTRTEAPTKKIGELLVSTQNIYDNVAWALDREDPPLTGRVPVEIVEQSASNIVELSAASFVIDIAATRLDDLFGDSLFTQTTREIVSLLDLDVDRTVLGAKLARLKVRASKSFRTFVNDLASTGGDVTVGAAGVHLDFKKQVLPADRLQDLVRILKLLVPDDEVREIRGRMRLYAADTKRQEFGLRDEINDAEFEGKVDERALAQLDHAPLNELYDVVLVEVSTTNEVIGERRTKHTLVQLIPVDASGATA